MLLLPLVRPKDGIRGVPWATVCLVVLNALALIATLVGTDDGALLQRVGQVIGFVREHPYLEPSAGIARLMGEGFREELDRARRDSSFTGGVPPIEVFERERLELEQREQRVLAELRALPIHRLGFTPARRWSATLLSSLFMHGGWLHLLGNLLFLWITAPFLEQRLGRVAFLLFYVACGAAANAAHALRFPQSDVPLVGASGAIAGLMGGFLVYFWSRRIRFLVIPTPVTVALPAVVVFPLWLFEQMWYARYAGEAMGVAFTAHVGGFVFGLAAAGVMMAAGLGAADEDAQEGRRASEIESAQDAFEGAMGEGDTARIGETGLHVLERMQAAGAAEEAVAFVEDIHRRIPAPVPARLWQACAAFLERHDLPQALAMYQELVECHAGDALALRALMRQGDLLRRQGQGYDARRAYEQARVHPLCTPAARDSIERFLAQLGRA